MKSTDYQKLVLKSERNSVIYNSKYKKLSKENLAKEIEFMLIGVVKTIN